MPPPPPPPPPRRRLRSRARAPRRARLAHLLAGMLLAALPALAPAQGSEPRVQFAIYDNVLYFRADRSNEDRAPAALFYLLSLITRYPAVLDAASSPPPPAPALSGAATSGFVGEAAHGAAAALFLPRVPRALHGTIGGCFDDNWGAPGAGQVPNGSAAFSFWRPPGVPPSVSRLLPDHDVAGWAYAWIPPLPLVARELAATSAAEGAAGGGAWASRSSLAFWSGVVNSGWREAYVACAAKSPELLSAGLIDWGAARNARVTARPTPGEPQMSAPGEAPSSAGMLKPITHDLRKLARHKFLVYLPGNTWSSSLKRLALAGGLLFMPRAHPHESLASKLLNRSCGEDILWYDGPAADAMCADMQAQLVALRADDAATEVRAARFAACADKVLSAHRLEAAALHALNDAAEEQRRPGAPPFPIELLNTTTAKVASAAVVPPGALLTRVEGCADMKFRWASNAGGMYAWQINAWYDDACGLRSGEYLRYGAV